MLTGESYEWLRMYRHFEKGRFWVKGAVGDQPNAYIEAMEIIEHGTR